MARMIRRILLIILGLAATGAGICMIRRRRRDLWMEDLDCDW